MMMMVMVGAALRPLSWDRRERKARDEGGGGWL